MSDKIRIDFAMAEGAVLRVLGLIERRGYRLCAIGMTEHEDGETASMELEIAARDAGRDLAVLDRQIRRLVGIRAVARSPMPMASAA